MLTRRIFSLALAALSTPALARPRSTKIVVPYPAGGPLDAAARILAEALKKTHGRVIVDNRPGAAGARGMLEVKAADADGKTLAIGALATLVVNPLLFNDLPYRPQDFAPVCLLSDAPNVLVMTEKTMAKIGINNAADLFDYIKANPGKLNCASGGTGSAGHIVNAILASQSLNTTHVPYAGAMAAQLSVLSGETDLMFDNFGSARAAIADGRLRVLAQTQGEALPEIKAPTLKSLGIDCDVSTWFGLVAPKSTPEKVREDIFLEIQKILSDAKTRERFERSAGPVRLLDHRAFAKWIESEKVKYLSFLKTLRI